MSEPAIETEIRPCKHTFTPDELRGIETKIRSYKHTFTPDELRGIAEKLAEATQELQALEDEKKAVASSYKERIEHAQLKARRESRRYRDGFEMRDVECAVLRDYDDGTINYVRTDNGESVLIRPMTAAEKQMRLSDAAGGEEETKKSPGRGRGGGR